MNNFDWLVLGLVAGYIAGIAISAAITIMFVWLPKLKKFHNGLQSDQR